ncbi:16S rRNA (guanine(966)-N(2))-methyltransferase RsmD [Anaplasma phagocytophilum]|uniref:16S rRNA (guanine(966)-N(2))-methyltransferase RsmD n=1 Tax=Anaplasma phagocytophilum TaxID=948 RepID=UPI002010AA27|nr:16S rRNA (guanine(966)-N(2))-methyltransferase RsmD [Anaplasma phagocytophilum]UQD54189.1 16S rRNA (guanine(966)-N(2))-methyltransferase RsmD [Anaplasma phagocytophilum]
MIRITSGKYRGRRIFTGNSLDARPAMSIIREAIFNILRAYVSIEDAQVCDVFCGSGSLSFEALSRGAKHACLVDINAANLKLVRRTATSLGVEKLLSILCCDVQHLPYTERQYNLAFVDPPYCRPELVEVTLKALSEKMWCVDGSIVVLRIRKGEKHFAIPQEYTLMQTRVYGCSELMFLQV